ncbi:MAG: translation elongation factor Ts [Bacilli bacterium]|nr:translation elongation factor Ts [Bacilli bacterium]
MMITGPMIKELREVTGAGMLDCKKALEAVSGDMEKAIDWLREKGITKAAKKAERIASEGLTNVLCKGNEAVILEVNSETDFVAKNEEFKDLINIITEILLNSNVKTVEEALKLNSDEGTLEELIINKTAKIGEKLSLRRFVRLTKDDNDVFGSYIHMGGKISSLVIINGGTEEVAKDVAMHIAAMRPSYLNRDEVPNDVIEKEKVIIKEQAINEGKPADIAEKMVMGRLNKYYKENCLEEQIFIKDDKINVGAYVKNNEGILKSMVRFEVGEGLEKRNDDFAAEVMDQINNI